MEQNYTNFVTHPVENANWQERECVTDATPNTATKIAAVSTIFKSLHIHADPDNTKDVSIGKTAGCHFYDLPPGGSYVIADQWTNLAQWWMTSAAASQTIYITGHE
jgi:hypothetical protein